MKQLSIFSALIACNFLACDTQRQQNTPQPRPERATVTVPTFDAQQAFNFLTSQTDFGPRNPGSKGHAACLRYLQDQMNNFADAVTVQNFSGTDHTAEHTSSRTSSRHSTSRLPSGSC